MVSQFVDTAPEDTIRELRIQVRCLTDRLDESRRTLAILTGRDPFGVLARETSAPVVFAREPIPAVTRGMNHVHVGTQCVKNTDGPRCTDGGES